MSEISTSFRLAYQEAGYKTGYFSETAYKELAKLHGSTVPMVVTDKGVMVGWNLSKLVAII